LIHRISDEFKALYSNDHLKKYSGGDPLFKSLPNEVANILIHDFTNLLSSDLTAIIFGPIYLSMGINLKDTVEWRISRDTIKPNDLFTIDTNNDTGNNLSRDTIPFTVSVRDQLDPLDQSPVDIGRDGQDPIDHIINNINDHVNLLEEHKTSNHFTRVGDHSKPSPPYLREGRTAKAPNRKNKKSMHFLPGDVFSPESPNDPPCPHDQESKGLDELTPTDRNDQEQEGLLQATTCSSTATTDHTDQERDGLLQATTRNITAPATYAPENIKSSSLKE
jgi:hypothetical protein